jgi:TPR repeat protein
MGHSEAMQRRIVAERLARSGAGCASSYYELGVDYSVGRHGVEIDLIEAHKWFNLAALSGDRRAQEDRAEVAADMAPWEIAEAQRQARAWLSGEFALAA